MLTSNLPYFDAIQTAEKNYAAKLMIQIQTPPTSFWPGECQTLISYFDYNGLMNKFLELFFLFEGDFSEGWGQA